MLEADSSRHFVAISLSDVLLEPAFSSMTQRPRECGRTGSEPHSVAGTFPPEVTSGGSL
jgi:hypothetical protein